MDSSTAEFIEDGLGPNFNLNRIQITEITRIIRDILLGDLSLNDTASTISQNLKVSPTVANQIQNKIMNDLFGPAVEDIKKIDDYFLLKLKKQELKSKAVIIATGTERKKLGISGESELTGRGVSYCVTCDGFFFKNKIVGVVGGSDCAATSALALADIAKKVYIFYRGEKLRCEEITTEKIESKPNTELIYNAIPKKILGEEKVTGLVISENGKEKTIELDGIFVEIGGVAIIDFTKNLGLELTKEKQIVVDDKMQTSVKGIFACGDVTNTLINQVVIATAEGAIAAKNAHDFIRK